MSTQDLSQQLSIAGDMAEELGLAGMAEELRLMAQRALTAQPSAVPLMMRRIMCRERDLNSRGRGTETYRRVLLPSGVSGWAADLATNLEGDWTSSKFRASERHCKQRGLFPVGTVVLELVKDVPANGPATSRAGRVVSEERGRTLREEAGQPVDQGQSNAIEWGLDTRRRGRANTEVCVDGNWVEV